MDVHGPVYKKHSERESGLVISAFKGHTTHGATVRMCIRPGDVYAFCLNVEGTGVANPGNANTWGD